MDSLPTLPAVAARLLTMLEESASAGDLARAIGADPSVSARVLSLACRQRAGRPVEGLKAAVELLGPEQVRSAVLGMEVFDRPEAPEGGLDFAQLRDHCLAVAATAGAAAQRRGGGADASWSFLGGLLHDIGKLALAHCLPKCYRRVLELARAEQCSAGQAERSIIGTDHTVIGRRLARHWDLPEPLAQTIWLHHQPLDAIRTAVGAGSAAAMVQLADAVVCERRIGFSGSYSLPVTSAELGGQLGFRQEDLADLRAAAPGQVRRGGADLVEGRPKPAYPAVLAEAGSRLARRNQDLAARIAEVQGRAKAFSGLRGFLQGISPTGDLPELCRQIALTAGDLLGPDQAGPRPCAFAIVPDEGGQAILAAVDETRRSVFRFSAFRAGPSAPDEAAAPAWEVLHSALVPPDAWSDLIDLHRYLCLPLLAEGRWVGGVLLPAGPPSAEAYPERFEPLREFLAFVLAAAIARAGGDRLAEQLAEANQRLAETREALAQAQALAVVGEMAAGAAHEINNPLAVIAGRAQLLAERMRTKKDRASAELIAEKAREISEIATEMMAFARPEPPAPKTVDVGELFSSLTKRLKDQLLPKATPSAVDIDIEAPCPPIWADAAQIEDVLAELVRNAVTAGGAVHIRLRARRQPGSDAVVLAVSDDGPGMEPAVAGAAFTPFYSHRPAGRGRGMGLARAKRCVEANGGKIWMRSRPQQGTSVFLELPRAPDKPTEP